MAFDDKIGRVAVVGGGVAGIFAAYLLSRRYTVVLFEKNHYLGGHTNTIVIKDGPDAGLGIDTGFIVCNPTCYPNFYRFLRELGVELRDSDMSFGFFCERTGLRYTGPALKEFIAQPQNFIRPAFLKMLWEQRAFNRRALLDLESGVLSDIPLGDYLSKLGCSRYFIDNYLIPLAASIWSSPDCEMMNFPAATFVTFFRNHGMLELYKRPRWQTVVGGSHAYVQAFRATFPGELRLNSPVREVRRSGAKMLLWCGEEVEEFDAIVLAAHADESLKILADAGERERELLQRWHYQPNLAQLHTDTEIMPGDRRIWASWNYLRGAQVEGHRPVAITYYMNRLQGLRTSQDYFVTLNRSDAVRPEKVIYQTTYTHPVYGRDSIAAQRELRELNGRGKICFCGSYMRYGFHEDAVLSALHASEALGVNW